METSTHKKRYYSLKYKGFPDRPRKLKKKWYLALKDMKVLIGYQTRKERDDVLFMQRPVEETVGPADGYDTVTSPTVLGESDNGGSVSVVTSPTPKRPRRRKCTPKDPLNLFRRRNCSKDGRRRSSARDAGPFSDLPIRHPNKKRRKGPGQINLFGRRDDPASEEQRR